MGRRAVGLFAAALGFLFMTPLVPETQAPGGRSAANYKAASCRRTPRRLRRNPTKTMRHWATRPRSQGSDLHVWGAASPSRGLAPGLGQFSPAWTGRRA